MKKIYLMALGLFLVFFGFGQTTYTWNGGTTGNWSTSTNWSPTRSAALANDILVFNLGSTITPYTFSGTSIGELQILNNTTLNINENLTVTNKVTVEMGSVLTIANATLTFNCPIAINGALQINQGGWPGGGSGTWTYGASSSLIFNTSNVYGSIDAGHVYWPASNGPTNVTLQGTGGINMGLSRTISMAGTFLIKAGVVNGTPLTLNGITQIDGGNFNTVPTYGSNSTLKYNTNYTTFSEWTGGGSTTIVAGNGIPANVEVLSGTVNLSSGGRGVPGNFTIKSSAGFSLNASDLYIGGNFVNDGSTWNNNNKAVFFVGAASSSIFNATGTQYFDYLLVNKTAPGALTLNAPTTINANKGLTFNDGIVNTTATNILTIENGATVSGSFDNTKFVNGPMAKVGTSAFTFPVGKTGTTNRLGRCAIGAPSTSSTFTAEYFVAPPPTVPATFAAPTGLGSLSTSEYWDIDRSAGTGAASVTLFFDDGTFSGVTSGTIFSGLTVGHRDGMTAADWKSETSSPTGSPAAGSITTNSALTSFSPFTIGTITAITLPLTVNSFAASKQNNNTNAINWKTTCTGASVTFELQRSINGITFLPINSITATQARCAAPFNYTDNYNATSPITYYKLKVISNTGEIKYSQIIAINNKNTVSNSLAIYPNVVKDKAVLVIESKTITNVNFVITDAKGSIIKKFTENLSEGANAYPLNLVGLSSGSYQISGIVDGALKTIRFIKSH